MGSILSISNVTKMYDRHRALHAVNLEIPESSVFGLLGPNGAGKTSLIRIINQITGPDSGEILFRGEKLQASHISRIGYLPEERGLYRKMKVGEQAVYLARLKGVKKKDAVIKLKYWFERFDMQTWWNKKVEELSKGMQQKVQFIVTILHEPELLILDEPFSGFDPINANLIKNEILELKKNGATIIFSTHNMGSVEELCDNIALINKSEKVLDGSVKQIRQQYRNHVYKISYRGTPMAFAHALWTGATILGEQHDGEEHTATIRVNPQLTTNDLLKTLIPAIEIKGFTEILPTINDIFIKVVGENPEDGSKSNFTE
jgi:ABC-2 type transport system ATP-binding protein